MAEPAVKIELAAVLPGEADMLAGVVADLRDDTRKLVYADWLEEHGDPRGRFLRRFLAAFGPSGKGQLSGSRPFSQAWRDLRQRCFDATKCSTGDGRGWGAVIHRGSKRARNRKRVCKRDG